jgi:hypothetical protein
MAGTMSGLATTLMLLLPPTMWLAGAQATVTTPATAVGCPSFSALGVELDRRISALKPGLTLHEFTSGFASQALNFEHPQSREGAGFIVGVSEGNATVTDNLHCRFDARGLLVRCRRECCRYTGRRVTLEQYDAIATGQTRSEVEARLCSPSFVEREGRSKVKTYYHIPLPVAHHDEGQGVLLVFENDRLTFKGMSPYY